MSREDHYTNSEADAGRFDRAHFGWERPDAPTRSEAEADEQYLSGGEES